MAAEMKIELIVPPEVAMPLSVVPAMPYEVLTGDAEGRRVVLRPRRFSSSACNNNVNVKQGLCQENFIARLLRLPLKVSLLPRIT